MKVLVTGAAGFVGGHLTGALVERGDEVVALVRRGEDTRRLEAMGGVEVVPGDLADPESLRRAVRGAQRVYSVAAKTGPWGLEAAYHTVNVLGLRDLIREAMRAGVERIVHTSSITVYGHRPHGVVTEDHAFIAEDNPYSRSKIAGEQLIGRLVAEQGAPVVVVRPGWVYGPGDCANFARIVRFVASGQGFIIGTGQNCVPLVYVHDVVQGMIRAGAAGDRAVGRAYNIVDDRRVTQAEYLAVIADALGVPHPSRRVPFAPLYVAGRTAELLWRAARRRGSAPPPLTTYGVTLMGREQVFSAARARDELGFAPQFDVKAGVAAGVGWYREWESGAQVAAPDTERAPMVR